MHCIWVLKLSAPTAKLYHSYKHTLIGSCHLFDEHKPKGHTAPLGETNDFVFTREYHFCLFNLMHVTFLEKNIFHEVSMTQMIVYFHV